MKKTLIASLMMAAGIANAQDCIHATVKVSMSRTSVSTCKISVLKESCLKDIELVKSCTRTDESIKEQCEGREQDYICSRAIREQRQHKEFIVLITEAIELGEIENKKEKAEIEKWEKERKRRAALPGVSIGDSANHVIKNTSWGRPDSVNKTTTSAGTREQWVYGSRNYLYFTNGILTTIQN